jgi:hypothetical protein
METFETGIEKVEIMELFLVNYMRVNTSWIRLQINSDNVWPDLSQL